MQMWVIEGHLNEGGTTSISPELATRFPLVMKYKNGLLTLHNYDGFKINFVGSWDMPFGMYRLSTALNSLGDFAHSASLVAKANCDDIEFYGIGLKLIGMSDYETGEMAVRAGTEVKRFAETGMPDGIGSITLEPSGTSITANFSGSLLRADEHVYSIMLTDEKGNPLPLYYTADTEVTADALGNIKSVTLKFLEEENVGGNYHAYVLVDTYPVCDAEVGIAK